MQMEAFRLHLDDYHLISCICLNENINCSKHVLTTVYAISYGECDEPEAEKYKL
jgi:hypothetical protein